MQSISLPFKNEMVMQPFTLLFKKNSLYYLNLIMQYLHLEFHLSSMEFVVKIIHYMPKKYVKSFQTGS